MAAPLAGIQAPVDTATMPKVPAAWVAAVQKIGDDGKPIPDRDRNLAALVDEAAKTSDLDSLIKLCSCDAAHLERVMTTTDAKGRTGFAQLSLLLEKTHSAPGYTNSFSIDYPGFNAPNHGAATPVDQQDYALLGLPCTGMRVAFMDLNDGPSSHDGWMGPVASS